MNSEEQDYDDPATIHSWQKGQRSVVELYLQKEECRNRGVSLDPAWFIAPYVAIWKIESWVKPGTIGWWAISGDLPTDYLSAHAVKDARSAMGEFAKTWLEAANLMFDGKVPKDFQVGNADMADELAPILKSRAELLLNWANDDSFWSEK